MRQFLDRFVIAIFAPSLALGLFAILAWNLAGGSDVNVTLDEPATEAVDAPRSISYVSEVLTVRAQEQASGAVDDIYTVPDLDIGRAQSTQARAMFSFISVVRSDSLADLDTKLRYLQAIQPIIIEESIALDLLELGQTEYDAAMVDVLRIIEDVMREEIREGLESRSRLSARRRVSFDLNPAQERVVTSLAPQYIVANTFFDETATVARREEVAGSVVPVEVTITQDQPILRVGDLVSEEDMEALEQLGLLRREANPVDIAAAALAAVLFAVLLSLYWLQNQAHIFRGPRNLLILGLLVLTFALIARFMVGGPSNLALWFPGAALAMILAVIFNFRLAFVVSLLFSALVGYMGKESLELAVYMGVGSFMSAMALRDAERIIAFFRAGVFAAIGYISATLIFRLPLEIAPIELLQLAGISILNGLVMSAGLTLVAFFVLGGVFGVLTILQLQELSRLDHPLLKELLRRAPGTYHHSIWVANLAEQGAERINANATLVRVGAFYHDVGKTTRPPFFVENQDGINPHDSLDAYSSARIILSHVTDGLALARKHRLPIRVRDFIAEHHGTRMVSFYYKALEQADGDESRVSKERFTYPGPKPQSRETAIVMLADAIESTSRAVHPNTHAAIEKLVNKIIDTDLGEGQLDDSGLTLGDVRLLRESFIETLQGRFHVRVRYPGNEELLAANAPEPAAPPVETAPPAETAVVAEVVAAVTATETAEAPAVPTNGGRPAEVSAEPEPDPAG